MKLTHALLATPLLAILATQSLAAPIISPFAADLAPEAYSADSSAPGWSAQTAFNGSYWNANGGGSHWVQADMGARFTLSQVRYAVGVLPANVTWQNIYLSDTPIGNLWESLTPVASRTGYTEAYDQFTLIFASPATGRYLQVVSNGGASWTALGDPYGRSNWVDPVVQGNAVPEPSGLSLSLAALAALIWRRRAAVAG
jgi:hypothetical protein